jgi:hypothetical protein
MVGSLGIVWDRFGLGWVRFLNPNGGFGSARAEIGFVSSFFFLDVGPVFSFQCAQTLAASGWPDVWGNRRCATAATGGRALDLTYTTHAVEARKKSRGG